MLAAGAADGHGHVAALVFCHGFQPLLQKLRNALLHGLHLGLRGQEIGHWRVASGELAQGGFVMRVGQHAHIKHVVGVHRHAALEGEGLEHQRHLRIGCAGELFDVGLQPHRTDRAGIHNMRFGADAEQQFALQFDGLHQVAAQLFAIQVCLAGPGLRQRVFAPGLGVAAHQRGG